MKRKILILACGAGIGIVAAVLQSALGIDKDVFWRWYWITALAVLVGAAVINTSYNLFYCYRMGKLMKLIQEERNQEFVDGVKALLKTAKGKHLRTILEVNLAAGYLGTGEKERTVAILEAIPEIRLKRGVQRLLHRINLFAGYFESGQYEKALAVYYENQPLFEKFKNHKKYGQNIAILHILAAITEQNGERAEELLEQAERKYEEPSSQKAFQEISEMLNKLRQGQTE